MAPSAYVQHATSIIYSPSVSAPACASGTICSYPSAHLMLECMENSGSRPKSRQNSSIDAIVSGRVCSPTCGSVRVV